MGGTVPQDFPQLLANEGLVVHAMNGWWDNSASGTADHQAIVLHHTASSANSSPSTDANYSFGHKHYNTLVDRNGEVWLLVRRVASSSGEISSVALNEALRGEARLETAQSRGLHDDTSANSRLFAVCAQNNGVGEHWSDALIDGIAKTSAVAMRCLGLPHAGFVTEHRILTSRKIDPCGANCPT